MNADREYLAAGFVLGGLSEDELSEARELEASDAEFRAELSSFRETLGLLAETDEPESPSAQTEAAILAIPQRHPSDEVPHTVSADQEVVDGRRSAQRRSRLSTVALALAASTLLVLAAILGGAAVVQYNERSEIEEYVATLENEHDEAQRLLTADDLAATRSESALGGSVTVSYSASEQLLYVTPQDMPAPEAGEALQMWVIDGEGAHDAGMMSLGSGQLVTGMDLTQDAAFGVTVEPEGGSVEPTSDPILVAEL